MENNIAMKSESRTESRAIYTAIGSAIIGFFIGIPAFMASDGGVALFSRGLSLGVVASAIASIVALLVYMIVGYQHQPKIEQTVWARAKQTVNVGSLATVMALLMFLSYALLFYIISQAFKGALLDMWTSSVLLAISTGLSAYMTCLMAAGMNAMRVSAILALFLVSGTFISMLTASDPYWWGTHFSSLGAGGGLSGYAFNATLIIAGLVVVALSKYIIEDFARLKQQGRIPKQAKSSLMQILLAGIGISLAFVGLLVYDAFPITHSLAAFGMAALFGAIIIMLPWLAPGFPPAFFVASYTLAGTLVASAWLFWGIGYFNFTVFELVAAAIIFTWLVLFVRHTAAMLTDEANQSAETDIS